MFKKEGIKKTKKFFQKTVFLTVFVFIFLIFSYKAKTSCPDIILYELYPNPSSGEKEFIEIKNESKKEINLSNWFVKDLANHKIYLSQKTIKSREIIHIEKNFSLNNSGDSIELFNDKNELVDSTKYGKTKKESSWSFDSVSKKWRWAKRATPGEENIFESDKPNNDYNDSAPIIINEILPNPKGKDSENEYIELYNPTKKKINLENWILKDSSKNGKYIFPKNSFIKKEDFLVLYRKDFKFAINNSKESVSLLNPNKEMVSRVSFLESAKENVSYNFSQKEKNWRWSKFLTPNKENKFNNLPTFEIKIDKKIYKDIFANFKVKIRDKDNDEIKIIWNFGDGKKSYKKETRHKYSKKGTYKVLLEIKDGSEKISKKYKIKVKNFKERKIRIASLSPNPKGKDSENEWIKLINKDKKEVNLKNWFISNGKNSKKMYNHPIKEDFIIKPGETKIITREICAFSLNNKKARIELLYPNKKIADKIKYKKEKIEEGEIYIKEKKQWRWKKEKKLKSNYYEKKIKSKEEIENNLKEKLGKSSQDKSKANNLKKYIFIGTSFNFQKINLKNKFIRKPFAHNSRYFYSFTLSKKNKHWIFLLTDDVNIFLTSFLSKNS